MKQLLWKEWMELRFAALLCTIGIILLLIFQPVPVFRIFYAFPGAPIRPLWCLAAIVVGCGLFAPEVGGGTLQFLTTMPLTRGRVWLAKVAAGLTALDLIVATTYPVWTHTPIRLTFKWQPPASAPEAMLHAIFCFCLALAVSTLVDRAVSSLIISLFGSAIIIGIVDVLSKAYGNDVRAVEACLYWTQILSGIAVFLVTSYRTVVHGETLRTSRRLRIAGSILLGWALVACVAVKFGGPLLTR